MLADTSVMRQATRGPTCGPTHRWDQILNFYRKYLRFLWNFKHYEFTCLPFLGTALHPGISLRFFKPVIAYFRFVRFGVIIFIDDLILIDR